MDFSAAEIAAAAGGRVLAGDPQQRFTELAIDSRRVPRGSLFVALPGARVDGHDFVRVALAAGAVGAISARGLEPFGGAADPGTVVIGVDDSLAALQAVARAWRAKLTATVIAVAGSNGKTTTKEAIAAVLREHGRTFATPGNENSQIGAPLAILGAPLDTEMLVLELGTSARGELARLAAIARPDLAVVTAAFAEHLEWLESVDGVVEAETEVLDALPPGALAVVGSAEPRLVAAAKRRRRVRVRSLGLAVDDSYRIERIAFQRDGTHFDLIGAPLPQTRRWRVPLLGEPAAWASSFAIAIGVELGLDPDEIERGLSCVKPAAHRLAPIRHPRRPLFVIDDCYNSNPASCEAATVAARALTPAGERLVLVLGDMLELGASSDQAHDDVGSGVSRWAPDVGLLVTVGEASRRIALRARGAGVPVAETRDAAEAARVVTDLLRDGAPTTLLVKGSRGIGLERVVSDVVAL
jgi:UDP-N-acetylmuramoyl-tripeptide--D-alanyl-D-alanine ligase